MSKINVRRTGLEEPNIRHLCKLDTKKDYCPKYKKFADPECKGCEYYKRQEITDPKFDPFWKPKPKSLEERITDLELKVEELEKKLEV